MSVASEITRLLNAKADLKTAIEGKGVTVSADAKLDAYPALVESISGGSIEDLITKENLVRIVVRIGNFDFNLDASNNFTMIETSSLLTNSLVSIKLIFADLELDYYAVTNYNPSSGYNPPINNFLVVSGIEFSILYTKDSDKVYGTFYRNTEQIGYLESRYD